MRSNFGLQLRAKSEPKQNIAIFPIFVFYDLQFFSMQMRYLHEYLTLRRSVKILVKTYFMFFLTQVMRCIVQT